MGELTPAEVELYQKEGWLVVDSILTAVEVEHFRSLLDSPPFATQAFREERTMHYLNITTMHPDFLALAKDPRIVGRVSQLLGPDVQLHHSKTATKPTTPNTGDFAWHQDFAYFPHTNSDLLAVMVMLDDATPENGCMSVLPGSFRMGMLSHHGDDGYWAGGCTRDELWADASKLVQLKPRAGGVSIHHVLTLHGSGPNVSGVPRRGVVFEYRAADAYQLADNLWADGGLQVAGVRSVTVRCDHCFSQGVLRLPNHRPGGSLHHGRGNHGGIYNQVSEFAVRQDNVQRSKL